MGASGGARNYAFSYCQQPEVARGSAAGRCPPRREASSPCAARSGILPPDASQAMLEGVTIEQLRTLRAVVESGSFSAAARKLGRVQAAVSQAIDRLESQLGLLLFDRSGRVPRLTPAGEAVAQAAARIETGVAALDELVNGLKHGTETELRIIVDVLFPSEALVHFAREFRALHPSVELVLFTDVLSAVTAHVRERRSSWGIAVEDADLRELERRSIAQVELVPVAAPEHPLAREQGPLDAALLVDAVQIVLGEHRPEAEAASA